MSSGTESSSSPQLPTPVPAENEGPDKTIEDDTDKDGPPLRWRGTSFTWNHAATTTLVGVGRDNIGGELEQYSWTFTFRPKYFIVDLPKDKVTVSVDIGAEVELTDSALTTDRNELLFQDLLAGVAYSRNLWESGGKDKGEYKTSASVSGRVRFATSKFSYGQGKYATTLLGTSLNQQLKLLGNKADALNNLTVGFSLTWGHLFAESYAPVNENAARPRQNASGQAEVSDVLGGYSFGMNTLTGALSADLPIYKGLQLSTGMGILGVFKHAFESATGEDGDCEYVTLTEPCGVAPRVPDAVTYTPQTLFRAGLSYSMLDVVDMGLGYQNITPWIGENGQRRNVFYSPDAQFYVDITANLDSIYTKATRRSKRPSSQPVQQTASR
jgi:hypothetical protein